MKFTKDNALPFEWEGISGLAYSSKEDFSNASAVVFEVTGTHGKVKTPVSDRVYYVLEGEGEFIIEDNIIPVSQSDVVIVPKNTPYDYRVQEGKVMKLFLVHTPAYEETEEVRL